LRILLLVPTLWAGVTGSSELFQEDARYSGVGQMRVGSSCTASRIVPRGAVQDEAPAYVLSAWRCYSSSLGTNELVTDQVLRVGRSYFVSL